MKSLTCAIVAVALIGLSGIAALSVQAEGNDANYPPLIKKFVERFNINPDEAQNVINELREERHQQMQEEMQSRFEEALDEAVTAGNLTQEQKELILAKEEEMRTRMQEMREETESWAVENDIDLKFLRYRGHGKGFGPRGGFRPGW